MNTSDRKEKQLTLIEFNEEQQAFNLNEDGQTPSRDGWMPIMWMSHENAVAHTKNAKREIRDQRIVTPKKDKLTTEEVIYYFNRLLFEEGFETAKGLEESSCRDIYLVCKTCDEGGFELMDAFREELTAYHYMDCEGGDCVERVVIKPDYVNRNQRIYHISMFKDQFYSNVKYNIKVVEKINNFNEENVKQAVRYSITEDGGLHLEAYLQGSHRYQVFKNAEKILNSYIEDYVFGLWYNYPSMEQLTCRELSPLQKRIYGSMFFGESDKPFIGLMDSFIKEYEDFKRNREQQATESENDKSV